MANRNLIIRFLRGMFAVVIAMSVVASASAHAANSGGHFSLTALHDGNDSPGSGDDAASAAHDSDHAKIALDDTQDGVPPADLCKMKCAFAMIAPIGYHGVAAHGRVPWGVSLSAARLPSGSVPAVRPPRS